MQVSAVRIFPFLTESQERRYKLAWSFTIWNFVNGTGKVKSDPKVVAHYREVCKTLIERRTT